MRDTGFDWGGMFEDLPREHGYERLRVEGVIPADLDGTLFRCGPALQSCFDHRYQHPFDGDGAVTAVRLGGGAAWGATRLIETPGLRAERAAGKALYPGYGTLPPGPRIRRPVPKNAANTSVMAWNRRLFALHEGSAPTEFEAHDLRTLGERDLGSSELGSGFSAHPHAVPSRRAIYNFGVRYGATTRIELFELRRDEVRRLGAIPLSGPTMVHDFAVTARYLVFFAPPLRLRVQDFVAGSMSYSDALAWEPEHGTEVVVVPIDAPRAFVRFQVEPFYQWHFANAFDREDQIIVDFVRYPDFATNRQLAAFSQGAVWPGAQPGTLQRATISPAAHRLEFDTISPRSVEFPRIDPATEAHEHRFVYVAAHQDGSAVDRPYDGIARIDAETGREVCFAFERGHYPGEPVFVPRRGVEEGDGRVMTLVYDATRHVSYLALFDAAHVDAGPIARAWFARHVPFTLHGTWCRASDIELPGDVVSKK